MTYVILNDWIKLDCKNDAFVSRKPIPKGTRILIERPLFQIGEPPQYQPFANALFLFSKFKMLDEETQKEILIQGLNTLKLVFGKKEKEKEKEKENENESNKNMNKHLRVLFPLRYKNNKIAKLISSIENSIKSENLKKYIRNKYDWNKLEILLNILEQYSIDLHFDMNTPYQHWLQYCFKNKQKSITYHNNGNSIMNKSINKSINNNNNNNNNNNINLNETNKSDVINLGKGLFRFTSRFSHCCQPTCNINVIDEIGTIEVRTIIDINQSNVLLTRNYLFNKSIKQEKEEKEETENKNKNLINYFNQLNGFENNLIVPKNVRRYQLLKCYHFKCQCKLCNESDKTRGFLCNNLTNNSNCQGCNGVVLCQSQDLQHVTIENDEKQEKIEKVSKTNFKDSKRGQRSKGHKCRKNGKNGKNVTNRKRKGNGNKKYEKGGNKLEKRKEKEEEAETWKCNNCSRIVSHNNNNNNNNNNNFEINNKLIKEKELENRLIGLESLIDYGFRGIDKSKLLYNLLDDACLNLSNNHWIIIRLLWICFEEAISNKKLSIALIYLKRHIELSQTICDSLGMLTLANKYELLADLLPINENYKFKAMQKAIQLQSILRGKDHSSVKRCRKKLMAFERQTQTPPK